MLAEEGRGSWFLDGCAEEVGGGGGYCIAKRVQPVNLERENVYYNNYINIILPAIGVDPYGKDTLGPTKTILPLYSRYLTCFPYCINQFTSRKKFISSSAL